MHRHGDVTKRLADPEFSRWLQPLLDDLEQLVQHPALPLERIEYVQGALVDLMDYLDPKAVRVPMNRRQRLTPS